VTRLRLVLALLACALGFVAQPALADNVSPLLVDISEIQPNVFSVFWRVPPTIPNYDLPYIEMPQGCTDAAPGTNSRKLFKCTDGLRGHDVAIRYPQFNPAVTTIIRLNDLDGGRMSKALDPQTDSWTVPAAETWLRVAWDYTLLGMNHILTSPDHLLFLVCLLWIAGTWKRTLITITGFTVAHSISLALSALKVVHIPEAPVEIAIALSILFLAREAAVGNRGSLTWRYPIVVSSSFGLLHGLGFAAALMEIGLPQKELVTGLLFFNVGVEFGQIVFIAALLAAVAVFKLLRVDWPRALIKVPVYAVGAMSMFWTLRNGWLAF
jgi:hypothetical protein